MKFCFQYSQPYQLPPGQRLHLRYCKAQDGGTGKNAYFPGLFQRNKLLPGGPGGPGGPCTDSPDEERIRGIKEYLLSKLHSPEMCRVA